ncbi:hypothetical protein [Amycolatopsis sp. NPDC059657]|uniref:hypothetical protein n=1 Tax=Amycolatopsis sp. NPDC059657 TaxID=3346899 RepID=UPI00366A9775
MTTFVCVGCDAVLTVPMVRVALPVHTRGKVGNGVRDMPVLMAAGTFAVDPNPSGPPWRRWSDLTAEQAAERGVFAPVWSVSFGARERIAMAPGDVLGTVLIPERASGYCCGFAGGDGPNLACVKCGLLVATRIDDCSLWQVVWLEPGAVRAVPGDAPAPAEVAFTGRFGEREAAGAHALAHLIAASDGRPVTVPDGGVAELFRRALDGLLPAGAPAKTVALAGPGLPVPDADILLVPGEARPGCVALPPELWRSLAFPGKWPPIPATGGFPDGVLRDDPPPAPARSLFEPDREIFLSTLARLPAVRQPWLREIYDRVNADRNALRFP